MKKTAEISHFHFQPVVRLPELLLYLHREGHRNQTTINKVHIGVKPRSADFAGRNSEVPS